MVNVQQFKRDNGLLNRVFHAYDDNAPMTTSPGIAARHGNAIVGQPWRIISIGM